MKRDKKWDELFEKFANKWSDMDEDERLEFANSFRMRLVRDVFEGDLEGNFSLADEVKKYAKRKWGCKYKMHVQFAQILSLVASLSNRKISDITEDEKTFYAEDLMFLWLEKDSEMFLPEERSVLPT